MSSCCWLLPIVSDVAYGSHSYVQELADEVGEQVLIGDKSSVHHVDDVLNAIQEKAGGETLRDTSLPSGTTLLLINRHAPGNWFPVGW